MSKVFSVAVLMTAMASVGWLQSGQKSGADAESCPDHLGVYTCTHTDPNETCKGVASTLPGVDPQTKSGNRKKTNGTINCTTTNQGNTDCVGIASMGLDCDEES